LRHPHPTGGLWPLAALGRPPLSEFKPKRKTSQIIEVLGGVVHAKQTQVFRLIGFWNPTEKTYHWYMTHRAVSAPLVYPLYRLRWTLELIFKASKRSFNLDKRLTSTHATILESLVLSSIIASFAAHSIRHLGSTPLSSQQRLAISCQRTAQVVVPLAHDFIDPITRSSKRSFSRLVKKIILFARELYEKNHPHRPTSLGRVHALLET
jgi:hypothetical protein